MTADDTDRLHVDLGTGLGGWTEPFRDASGWRSVGIDIRDDLEAGVIGDIRQLPLDCSPDLLTMSPPCTEFARWMLPWLDEPNPDLSLVEACLDAVDDLEPTWWVLENSRGLSMYWREADQNVGPYYLWGNLPPVDVTLTDGGKMAVSGENPEKRAEIPYELADGVRRAVEGQRKLVTDGGTVEDGTYRPPCREEANTTPYAASEDLERRACPQCRYYFDCGKDSDRVFCSLACERRYGESNELIADGGTVEDGSEQSLGRCETEDCHRDATWVVHYPNADDHRHRSMCDPCRTAFMDALARAPNEVRSARSLYTETDRQGGDS